MPFCAKSDRLAGSRAKATMSPGLACCRSSVSTSRPSFPVAPVTAYLGIGNPLLKLEPALGVGLEELLLLRVADVEIVHPAYLVGHVLVGVIHRVHHAVLAHHLDHGLDRRAERQP